MHVSDRYVSRRSLLSMGAAVGGIGVVTPGLAFARVTPNATMGPFYPILKPLDQDADLTRVSGHDGRAQGELLHLIGRVLDGNGVPIVGASVEIWQADSNGRYTHPYDSNPAPLDADFQGYGIQTTDAQGRYRFRTVKPAPYGMRTPHVHFQVTAKNERKVTQMFFPGEPLNERDGVLRGVTGDRGLLFARLESAGADLEPGSKLATFDIVLSRG